MSDPSAGAAPVRRVLVVDDDPDINRLVRLRLAARGYEVDSAGNGEEALERLAARPADLMFLDVSMPRMGGLEVLEHLQAARAAARRAEIDGTEGARESGHGDGPAPGGAGGAPFELAPTDLAVILMTAFGSEAVAIDALRRGADDYLRKPFDRQDFEGVLERTVSRLVLRRQNAALQQQLEAQRRELAAELARAGRVQADLLPATVPTVPGFDLAARCLPARAVGGDFYDWQTGAGGLTVSMGDVMGKGMPAALLMATVRSALRTVALRHPPAVAIRLTAAAVASDLSRWGGFVTLFHAQLDAASRRLSFVDAGHGCVFVRRANGEVLSLPPRGLPLGIAGLSPDGTDYEAGEVDLQPGDTLVVYSDGLLDADPDLRLDRDAIGASLDGRESAAEMVSRLVALPRLDGPPSDDLTVVVLRCCPVPRPGVAPGGH
jgi:sigma-B regulation protein RsbU (phosphoserine phosphatase)